jgi:hypothetical protein
MRLEGKIGLPALTDYEKRCVEESRSDGRFLDLVAIIDRLTKEPAWASSRTHAATSTSATT